MTHAIPELKLEGTEGNAPDLVLTSPTSDKVTKAPKAPKTEAKAAPKGEKKVAKAPKAATPTEPTTEEGLRAEIDLLSAQVTEKTPEVEKAANASKEAKKELRRKSYFRAISVIKEYQSCVTPRS